MTCKLSIPKPVLSRISLVVCSLLLAGPIYAENFFRVEQVDGKWRLVDPEGNPFFLRGLNHYGDGSHMPWNLESTHGTVEAWRASLPPRLSEWGFNYLPPSIGPSAIDPSSRSEAEARLQRNKPNGGLVTRTPEWTPQQFASLDFPFTIFLEYPRQYMAGPGLPDVFSEDFARSVDEKCREVCAPLKDNRMLIGYHFCHNPPWHPRTKSFDQWIDDITKEGMAGRTEWVRLMRQIYGTIDRWREVYGYPIEKWEDIETLEKPLRGYVDHGSMLEDRKAFMKRICHQWYRVYSEAVKRHDPNHLILGDRNTLHLQPLPEYAVDVMKHYVDVLSVNVMGPPHTALPVLEQVTRHWDGPIHLADTGAGIYDGEPAKAGFTAKDLEEFEETYSGLIQLGVTHPQVIGLGWCGFYETPHPGGRSGLVDCRTGEPIPQKLEILKKWNAWSSDQFPRAFANGE